MTTSKLNACFQGQMDYEKEVQAIEQHFRSATVRSNCEIIMEHHNKISPILCV